MSSHASRDVVVILPDLLGSTLRTADGAMVWGPDGGTVSSLLEAPATAAADALVSDAVFLPGWGHVEGHGPLEDAVARAAGDAVRTFPYDWRMDCREHARRLAEAASCWLEDGGEGAQLVLVAHGMGGLIARFYLEVLDGWRDTRGLITLGTPFMGAVGPLEVLVNGLGSEAGLHGEALTRLLRTMPSLYQAVASWPVVQVGRLGRHRPFDLLDVLPNLDPELASAARAFHVEMDDAVARNRAAPDWRSRGYQTYPVLGTLQRTLQDCRMSQGTLEVSELHGRDVVRGDGLVTRLSATPPELPAHAGRMYAGATHGSLHRSPPVLARVVEVLEAWLQDGADVSLDTCRDARGLELRMPSMVAHDTSLTVVVTPEEDVGPALVAELTTPDGRLVAADQQPAEAGVGSRFVLTPRGPGVHRVVVRGVVPDAPCAVVGAAWVLEDPGSLGMPLSLIRSAPFGPTPAPSSTQTANAPHVALEPRQDRVALPLDPVPPEASPAPQETGEDFPAAVRREEPSPEVPAPGGEAPPEPPATPMPKPATADTPAPDDAEPPAVEPEPEPRFMAPPDDGHDPFESAVWELMAGHESPRAIADRYEMTHGALLDAFRRYVDAGRAGLSEE